jgi:hypothetical protein
MALASRANADRVMCEKCKTLDDRIARYRALVQRVTDQQTLEGIKRLIEDMEAQKRTLHPKE